MHGTSCGIVLCPLHGILHEMLRECIMFGGRTHGPCDLLGTLHLEGSLLQNFLSSELSWVKF